MDVTDPAMQATDMPSGSRTEEDSLWDVSFAGVSD